ncbi:MAG: RHS repeat-associated core domain-containing protein, partial [Gemmatimonadaceae bacterium]
GAGTQHAYYYDQYGELTDDRISAGCYGSVVTPDEGANYANCTRGAGWTRYSYDAVGNRTDLGATYYYGNRLGNFNGGFLNYDADGNVSQKYGIGSNPHNQLFYWNPESRLESVSYDQYYAVKYEYNALGKPVKKYRQGALDRVWLWDGEQLLAEFDGNNARVADYQYSGTDQPYAYTYGAYAAGGVRYHEMDALGNVIGAHEGTSVTQTITYDAWGVPSTSGNLDSHLMWKGLPWEGDVVGLYYMRGRWYDPELGRFIQEDPIHSGVNDYVFANNDPVNGSDPSGMCTLATAKITETAEGIMWECLDNGSSGTFPTGHLAPINVTAWPFSIPRESGASDNFGNPNARGGTVGVMRTPAQGSPNTEGPVSPTTYRTFGPNGRARTDIDKGHDHGFGDPHAHDWDWSDPNRPIRVPREITPADLTPGVQGFLDALLSGPFMIMVRPPSICAIYGAGFAGCKLPGT